MVIRSVCVGPDSDQLWPLVAIKHEEQEEEEEEEVEEVERGDRERDEDVGSHCGLG